MTKEINLFDEPIKINEDMRQSLARVFADNGFREYLIRTAQASHQNALTALDIGKMDDARYYANRAKVLKQLLEKMKNSFIHFETIKNQKEPLRGSRVEKLEEIKL